MMVDFFDHDDQESIELAEAILDAAARHHILIYLHGVWKPTGWQRPYPNLMNHEGALNLEYLKWSDLCTPEHNLMMAFTRLIAGPMDYHLGGFRAVPRAQFKPRNVAHNVLGTRCHMLAMYVCFDNPAPMVADYPEQYPNTLTTQTLHLSSVDTLVVHLALDGGFVAQFTPMGK
jgi:alpha-glucosidase